MRTTLVRIAAVGAVSLLAACSSNSPTGSKTIADTSTPAAGSSTSSSRSITSGATTSTISSGNLPADGPTDAPSTAGAVIPGTDLHVPQPMDCSGSNTSKETKGSLICEYDVPNPGAAYNFFLKEIPKAGFHLGSDSWNSESGSSVSAQIYFGNATFNGICAVDITGHQVIVQLNKI